MWSSGGLEGGGQEEREGASLPHRPPPGTHSAAPARALEETLMWPHNKRLHGRTENPQPLPRQCPPGWEQEGFGDLNDFKHRKNLGRWRGTLNHFSPQFLTSCQGTWALLERPGQGCSNSDPLTSEITLTLSVSLPLASVRAWQRPTHTCPLIFTPLQLQLGLY